MHSTIDMAGRLVIPKALRDENGLSPGTKVSIVSRDGRIEIEPLQREHSIVRKGRFSVLAGSSKTAKLTQRQVNESLRQIRERKLD